MRLTKILSGVIILIFSNYFCIYSQESSVTAGGEASGAGGSASYSIGQVFYITNFSESHSEAQGVQQPYEISVVAGIGQIEKNINLSAFPNPTNDFLTLLIEDNYKDNYEFKLFDIQGKLISSRKIYNEETQIDMQGFPQAVYFLSVLQNKREIKTFKIIKN